MVFERGVVLDNIYDLATHIDEVPADIRQWVEDYFMIDRPLSYYQPFLHGVIAATEIGDWEKYPQAFGPLGYLAVGIAHELVARGLLQELLH
ncbi:MAG: hypothetical protein Q8R53_03085 [Nanoarchaeota archaeon]|nr:hypothetical protein [Nanoarchaeota archaeon]